MKILIILSLLLGPALSSFAETEKQELTIMTFNVENLFDTIHRETDGNDATYLPLNKKQSLEHKMKCAPILNLDVQDGLKRHWHKLCMTMDWNEDVLKVKMERLAKTILQVNQGRGPDILFLQEVENPFVVERLRKEFLAKAFYHQAILIEGKDARGIDTAILTRLPIDKKNPPKLHPPTPFSEATPSQIDDTRQILEATIHIHGGEKLSLLAVHLPAQHLPRKMRLEQMDHLKKIKNSFPPDRKVIVAGDFNISANEDEEFGMYSYLSDTFKISHQISCQACKGTYYYRGWSFLDAIGISENLMSSLGSVKIVNGLAEQRKGSRPKRFRLPQLTGVSDHFPLMMTLNIDVEIGSQLLNRRTLFWDTVPDLVPVAFFDADSTLRVSRSGSPSANGPRDVKLLPFVADKIAELNQQGFYVAIVSNQGGVPRFVSFEDADAALFYTKQLIEEKGGYIDYIDFANAKDIYRKPNVGMFFKLEDVLRKLNPKAKIDLSRSFMVGDAAYKKNEIRPDGLKGYNFSNSDRVFAENLGIPFFEPNEYFGWAEHGIKFFHELSEVEKFERELNLLP